MRNILSRVAMVSLLSVSAAIGAANPTNKASVRIGEVTLPTISGEFNLEVTPKNLSFMRIDVTIVPLELSVEDGKAIVIDDSAGNYVALILDNAAPLEFQFNLNEQTYFNFDLMPKREYDFTIFIGSSRVRAFMRTSTGIIRVGDLPASMTPPFQVSLRNQRTGVTFKDLVIKER